MKKTLFQGLILGAAIMLLGSGAMAGSIGIQFVGGGGGVDGVPMVPTDTAGAVVVQANWNALPGSQGGDVDLLDDQGNPTGAVLEYYSGSNTWAEPIVDAGGDFRLMRGYLDTTNNSTTIVIVSGVPYASYDVYCYGRGDGGSDRQGNYYVNDPGLDSPKPLYNLGGDVFLGTYVENGDPGTMTGGNYIVFHGESGDTLMVFANPDQSFPGGGGVRAPLNGIQIVDTSGE